MKYFAMAILGLVVISMNVNAQHSVAYFRYPSQSELRVRDNNKNNPSADTAAYIISGSTISIEAWVFPTTLTASTTGQTILRRPKTQGVTDSSDCYALFITYVNNIPHFAFSVSNLTFPAIVVVPDTVRLFKWIHVAGTYDGTDLRIYLDGSLKTQLTSSVTINSNTGTGLYLGRVLSDGFEGLIDEVRLWSTARTSGEILGNKDVELSGSETGLAGYWKLEKDTTLANGRIVARDYSPHKNDLLNLSSSVSYLQYSPLDAIGPASFTVSPLSIDFGTIEQGAYTSRSLSVTNSSANPLFAMVSTNSPGVSPYSSTFYVAANSTSSAVSALIGATGVGLLTGEFQVFGNSSDTGHVSFTVNSFPLQRFDGNNISVWVSRIGSFGLNPLTSGSGFEWPKGSGKTAVFESGIWVGAKVNGQIRMAASEYVSEFKPGSAVGGTPADPLDPHFRAYKINTGDNAGSNTDYAQWPANLGAPTNSDGTPKLYGNQTLFAVYNDLSASGQVPKFDMTPLGAEVQQTTFGFNTPGVLSNTVFLRFKVINRSSNVWKDTYIALWSDPDLGFAMDDLIGIDTARTMGFVYNGTPTDAIYGSAPPALGYKILKGAFFTKPIQAFAYYYNGAPANLTDPQTVSAAYNFLQGKKGDGTPYIVPSTADNTKFPVSGDPVTATGWLDAIPGDRRFLFSTGPLTLEPGQSKEFIAAVIIAQGTDYLNSIARLREGADSVQTFFDNGQVFGGAVENVSTITLPKDSVKTLDDRQHSGATLNITADSTGATVEVASYVQTPPGAEDMGASSVGGVGKFLEVDVQGLVTWPVQIKIYYTANDLSQAGAQETDLQGVYYWNGGTNQWNLYSSSGTDDQGRGPSTTGIDTTNVEIDGTSYEGFVYANAYHLTLMRIGATGGALPVQMGALSAVAEKNIVRLRWGTTTETNCFGFDIERKSLNSSSSASQVMNSSWLKVGFVKGAGTSVTAKAYSFSDPNVAPGKYSYRIKKIDKDGSFSYAMSTEIEVGIIPHILTLSQNYPNPFNPTTTMQFTLPENGRATLKIFDMLGREMALVFDEVAEAGKLYQAKFDASKVASGMYFSRLEFGEKQLVKKMMLLK